MQTLSHPRQSRCRPTRALAYLSLATAVALSSGCTLPREPKSATPNRAFITYWPPEENSGRLRLAVKDLIDLKGEVTTAGSEFLLKSSKPAERDAACLAIARARGVQFVGKTNTTELAVMPSGINEYFGTPRNPRFPGRIPGGSSSGSAAAVGAGQADVAFGTDTAGSVRIPAACCGVVGLKTTFGLVSLKGVYPIDPTRLDTVGPLARDIEWTARGMDLLQSGFMGQYRRAVAAAPSGQSIRVGRLRVKGTAPEIERAVDEALAAAGFQVVELGDTFRDRWAQAQADAITVFSVSAWIYDQKFRNEAGVTLRTKGVVALGQFKYGADYRKALARIPGWKLTLGRTLDAVDFIALPTLQALPPRVPTFGGSVAYEARVAGLQNTAAVNLAGNPALAVPVPVRSRGVSLTSLQLVGPPRSEAQLLAAGRLVEKAVTPAEPRP